MQYAEPTKSAAPRDYFNDEPRKKKAGLRWLIYPIYFTSGVIGLFLLYRSFGLYQLAFSRWGVWSISDSCSALNAIPLAGGWIASGCGLLGRFVVGTIALLSLISLTGLQSLPTLLYFHPASISAMVDQLRSNLRNRPALMPEGSDNAEIETLVKRHNQLGDKGLRTLLLFSVGAFAAEGFIIWSARNGRADMTSVLVDSLAFELLVAGTLAFAGVFRPRPRKSRQYGS